MPVEVGAPGAAARPGTAGVRLSREEFAAEFTGVSRALWCIAASVVGDRTRAEDVVQEAAVAAMQKLDEFEPGTSFLAWMGRFVRYTALNEARRQKTRAAGTLDGVDVAVGAGPETPSERSARVVTSRGQIARDQGSFDDRVLSALDLLDETARACLLLRAVHDMSYKDIALALDVPEGTAMSHVHRARQSMRQRLTPDRPSPAGERNA